MTRGLLRAAFCSFVPNVAVGYQTSLWSHDMDLVLCPLPESLAEVRRVLSGRSAELAPDRELCVRSKSPVARRLRSHAVYFQPLLSKFT
jgi:hypothetical protein